MDSKKIEKTEAEWHEQLTPEQYRVNGVVRNMDEWYRAFDIRPTDRLYLAPEQRVHIW